MTHLQEQSKLSSQSETGSNQGHSTLPVDPLDLTAVPHPRFSMQVHILSICGDSLSTLVVSVCGVYSCDLGFLHQELLQHAIAYMEAAGSTSSSSSSSSSSAMYYGSSATMNVWSPNVEVASEFSLTQMWILAGSFNSDLNSIEAGWQVGEFFLLAAPIIYSNQIQSLKTKYTQQKCICKFYVTSTVQLCLLIT
jgi:hypothetical protein